MDSYRIQLHNIKGVASQHLTFYNNIGVRSQRSAFFLIFHHKPSHNRILSYIRQKLRVFQTHCPELYALRLKRKSFCVIFLSYETHLIVRNMR